MNNGSEFATVDDETYIYWQQYAEALEEYIKYLETEKRSVDTDENND